MSNTKSEPLMSFDFEHSKCNICKRPPTNVIKYINDNLEEFYIPTCGDTCSRSFMVTLPTKLVCVACSKKFATSGAQVSMISHSDKSFMEIVCSVPCVHARNTKLNQNIQSNPNTQSSERSGTKIKLLYKCKVCQTDCNKKCSRCGLDYYCSSKCQRADWPNHKNTCNKLE